MKLTNLLKGHRVCYENPTTGELISATVVDIVRDDWVIISTPNWNLPIPVRADRILYREFPRGASLANS